MDIVVGCTDGFRDGYVEGWAWRPNSPHRTVVVQLLVNGAFAGEATACLPRPDLSTAGIGHGQHAFAIPLTIGADAPPVIHLTVRVKDGDVLPSGEFDYETSSQATETHGTQPSIRHLEDFFGNATADGPLVQRRQSAAPESRLNFVLYAANGHSVAAQILGMPEYSYVFVLNGFREILRKLGTVHMVREPADADTIHDRCVARGESCLLLSFTPPQNTPLGLRCPTVPVIAWEFGSIPTGGWADDAKEDWRFVLRQTGRAITISDFAARAIRSTMGAFYPVAFVPTPVWDRQAGGRARRRDAGTLRAGKPVTLSLAGFVWDSREGAFSIDMPAPRLPDLAAHIPARVLPMRGAQLALAMFSAADEAHGRSLLQAQEAALSEAAARTATEAELKAVAPAEAAPPVQVVRGPVRMAAYLARQFYRNAVRGWLPQPLARLVSRAGQALVTLRSSPSASVAVLPEVAPIVPSRSPEPPPTARYLPVGDAAHPASIATPPKYLPAADDAPLEEPALADFHPDPFPAAPAPAPRNQRATLDGIVFTAVLSPKDGRKNWQDILTAFTAAFVDTKRATLVFKMIGADPTFWWYELNRTAKLLPPFACRVVVLSGFLDDANYAALIGATHFVVNASLAEGQCLPLVEFMSAGRPAIAPLHTAMLDYITPENAVIVASALEFCSWPHDPRNHLITSRYRIEWPSLRDAFATCYRIAQDEPARFAAMSAAAAASVRAYCEDAVVGPRLAAFLGLGDEAVRRAGWEPETRPAAEPLLECVAEPLSALPGSSHAA